MAVVTPSATTRGFQWRMGGRGLFLGVAALSAPGTIQRQGLQAGIVSALFFGGFVWLIVWPLWLLTETEAIASRIARLPGWSVVLAWPLGFGLLWLLEPDHGLLVPRHPPLFLTLPVFWLTVLTIPLLTVRWYKRRRSTDRGTGGQAT